MRKLKYFTLFILLSCKINNKNEKESTDFKTNSNKNNIIQKEKNTTKQNIDVRGKTILLFNERDSISICTTFFTNKKIDSVSSYKKKFKAEYYSCGKGVTNMKLFNYIKNKNIKDYNSLKNITTAHNLIINKDTLYVVGRKRVKCYKVNDSVSVKSTIYKFFIEKKCLNMIVVDDIKIIEPNLKIPHK